jgi:hypothetical protein
MLDDEPTEAVPPLQQLEPLDGDQMNLAIGRELYLAIQKLGVPPALLALIGSYGATLDDGDVLTYLRAYNDTGTYWQRIVC